MGSSQGRQKGVPRDRGEMSTRNGVSRAGLTSVVVLLMQAGDVRTPHKEDGVDGHGPGRRVSRTPRGCQWHLEVDPGLAQSDETDDQNAQ